MTKTKTRKCWSCRKEMKDTGKILCKDCQGKEHKGVSTMVIYHTV